MTINSDESKPTIAFELSCTDCGFETVVEGDIFEALDVANTHQAERGSDPSEHFVNVERER